MIKKTVCEDGLGGNQGEMVMLLGKGTKLSHEKEQDDTVNKLMIKLDNWDNDIKVMRMMLLSLQRCCLRCHEKKELPPELDGLCSACELEL